MAVRTRCKSENRNGFSSSGGGRDTWPGRKSRPVNVTVGIPSAEQLLLNMTPCSPRSTRSVTRTSIGEVATHTSASTMFSDATTSWPNSARMPARNSRIARSGSVKRMRAIGCLISTNSSCGYPTSYGLRTRKDGEAPVSRYGEGSMQPSVKKSGAACGAEIGFDLAQDIDDPTFREIERIFHDNIVVVFRGQQVTNERHIEFSSRFGELEVHIVKKYLLAGFPQILLISNVRNEAGEHIGLADAGFTWHTDTSYRRRPSRCSLLYAKEVPCRDGESLGDTVFANTIAAYEALPKSMKQRIDGLKAIHRYSARRRVGDSPRPKPPAQQLAETPDIARPIVRTHPYTGCKSLYVTAGECAGIKGMPEDEAVDLIAELDAHCVRPEFFYLPKWQVGDLLMWDNAPSTHLAICDYALPQRRLMHRTTVIGTVPFQRRGERCSRKCAA